MADSTSNSDKKRLVRDGVKALRSKPGWDPSSRVKSDVGEELNRVSELARADKLDASADECPACVAARAELGDETAYCDTHMREILGF